MLATQLLSDKAAAEARITQLQEQLRNERLMVGALQLNADEAELLVQNLEREMKILQDALDSNLVVSGI